MYESDGIAIIAVNMMALIARILYNMYADAGKRMSETQNYQLCSTVNQVISLVQFLYTIYIYLRASRTTGMERNSPKVNERKENKRGKTWTIESERVHGDHTGRDRGRERKNIMK